jgi:transglutaminase-like putative cysteine protease
MLVSIDWHSTYRYDPPVRLLNMELHVVPASDGGQHLAESTLTVEPEGPVHVHAQADAFGNTMHSVSLLGPVERVRIALRARVQTASGPVAAPALTPLIRLLALRPTRRTPHDDPRLHALAGEAGDPSDPLAFAQRLADAISGGFEYAVGQTTVGDTALDFLEHRRGVCQDYAHLMLAVLRLSGVPALYVSGYLAPEAGTAGADASHAWVRVHAGGAWHGFDAVNDAREDERYVVTALGRDYDDVAPVRGSYRGLTEESWSAALSVETHDQ